jgi:hypothetical protein
LPVVPIVPAMTSGQTHAEMEQLQNLFGLSEPFGALSFFALAVAQPSLPLAVTPSLGLPSINPNVQAPITQTAVAGPSSGPKFIAWHSEMKKRQREKVCSL